MLAKRDNAKKLYIAFVAMLILTTVVNMTAEVLAAGYIATWSEYQNKKLSDNYTYNDVVDGIEDVLSYTVKYYKSGDNDEALEAVSVAKNSYWGDSGLKIAMQKQLPSASKKTTEADFTSLNNLIRDGASKDDLSTQVDVTVADLRSSANKLDGVEEDVDIIEETTTSATEIFNQQYYSTWAEYTKAAGIDEAVTKWTPVADAMSEVFRIAKEKYAAGDNNGAYNCINDGYYGYYETTGFERNAMAYISGSRKSEVELQFSACKTAAKGKDADDFNKQVDILRTMIRTDANQMDGVTGGESTSGAVATFIACFSIILREGFEAILVLGAIIAYLSVQAGDDKERRKKNLRPVYIGSIIGVVLSFVLAWLLNLLKLANSASQEIIEGVTALLAVAVLYYVSNWMLSKSETDAWNKYIKEKTEKSAASGSMFAMAFTAFLAVFREGAEVVLFFQPLIGGDNMASVWGGLVVGLVILVIVYFLVTKLSVRLPIKPFFIATSVLMFIMSISFLGSGIKELIEGDVIPMTSPDWLSWIPSNNVMDVLGIYPTLQTLIPQLILLIVTVILFIYTMRKNNRIHAEAEAERAKGAKEQSQDKSDN